MARGGAGRLVILAALGGAGFLAWRGGYVQPYLAKLGIGVDSTGSGTDAGEMYGPWQPASSPVTAPNRYEQLLRNNWSHVHQWARDNVQWVAAMIQQESGGNVTARGGAGEIGLMQVKPATATWMRDIGYGALAPTEAVLATEAGGIYYGTAFLQYLSKLGHDRAWIIKAYNGGPGWEGLGDAYKRARETYYSEVAAKQSQLYGADV